MVEFTRRNCLLTMIKREKPPETPHFLISGVIKYLCVR